MHGCAVPLFGREGRQHPVWIESKADEEVRIDAAHWKVTFDQASTTGQRAVAITTHDEEITWLKAERAHRVGVNLDPLHRVSATHPAIAHGADAQGRHAALLVVSAGRLPVRRPRGNKLRYGL